MQFQFSSDNQTDGGNDMAGRVEQIVRARLARIQDRLTRVEVHVGDVSGPRDGGDDKRCVVELRPAGMAPISATDQASDVFDAVSNAADKALVVFERQVGKRTDRKGH